MAEGNRIFVNFSKLTVKFIKRPEKFTGKAQFVLFHGTTVGYDI